MSPHERMSPLITFNRVVDDWSNLVGDEFMVTPLVDGLMHLGHVLKLNGKTGVWRRRRSGLLRPRPAPNMPRPCGFDGGS